MVEQAKDMSTAIDYKAEYDRYWQFADRIGESSGNMDRIAEQILMTCGPGRTLDIGSGEGQLVKELLRLGVDAHGVDVSEVAVARCNGRLPGRFTHASVLALPFEDGSFKTAVSTDCMDRLAPADIPQALKELHRVAERFVFLQIATKPDREGHWHLTLEDRTWWEARCFEAGFRKHPLYYRINSYESLNNDGCQIHVLLEKVPYDALRWFDLYSLSEERLLHSDMLRETGRRSDAHCIRYYKAAEYIRPGDRVLDVACGLGYGSHILFSASKADSVLGVDSSEFAISYASAHYQQSQFKEFAVGDAQNISFVPDHSIDFIAAFETIEHVEDPVAYLRELKRVLKPGGRIMACAPNEWVDETGRDPNPHHLHVYTWQRLVAEVGSFFLLEQGIFQVAGGALKCPNGSRNWTEFPVDQPPDLEAEWVIVIGMLDPVAKRNVPYIERAWRIPDSSQFHVAAFGRDYDNPWLLKSMVAIGSRMRSEKNLISMQERVLSVADNGSIDYAAALCGRIYSHLNENFVSAAVIKGIESEVWRYTSLPASSPQQLRWQVSLLFAAGELEKRCGRADIAARFYSECASRDVLPYSPLLGNKTLDALYCLAIFSIVRGDIDVAKEYLIRSLNECKRLVSCDWLNVIGDDECPLDFGLPELAQLIDKASRAAYLLNDLHSPQGISSRGLAGFFERQIHEHKEWVANLSNDCERLVSHLSDRDVQIANLNQAVADRDVQIANLNQAVADRDVQIASLNQAVAVREGQIASLEQAMFAQGHELAQIRNEANLLHERNSQLLQSKSWRWTRPLRAALEISGHATQVTRSRHAVYNIAATIGSKLPISPKLKTRVRKALLAKAFPKVPNESLEIGKLEVRHGMLVDSPSGSHTAMRPECCGLIDGLVSVVLPVYNQADLIAESIESVLRQTYQNFELIIINDGSSDGVEKILRRYVDHPKVRCFTQSNQRLPKALSNGFSFARGEFWTWTSADNIMEPRMLEMLVSRLQAEPELGMTYADYYAIDDRGDLLHDRSWRAHNRPNPASGEIRLPRTTETLSIVQDNFIGPCFMYRGWIGRCLGDYDPQLGVEDYDYWMRVNAFFAVRHLGDDSLLYRYRVHDNTLSAKAHEHKILEKAQRLMAYEKERSAFYDLPLAYVADSSGRTWLQGHGIVDAAINGFEKYVNVVALTVISGEFAEKHISELLNSVTPVAIIIDRTSTRYHKLSRLFDSGNCIVLACDKVSADRVKLVSSICPVIDANSAVTLSALEAFAKNLFFIRATRTAEELKREMPCPISVNNSQHVALQVDSFTQGGMENVVIDLALSLEKSGYRVTIANFGKSGDAAEKAKERGLKVAPMSDNLSDEAYRSWLIEERVDLVNAHYSIRGADVCFRLGVPFVQTIHNSYVWLDPVQIEEYRTADQYTDQYICVSMTAARYADVVLGLDASKMRVVPNGIDPDAIDAANFEVNRTSLRSAWGVEDTAPVYLNVASIMATKAQLPLVKAFAQVVEKIPQARLVLLGAVMEAPYQAAIERAVRELGLQQHVIFAGYDRQVSRYYHASDVFVLPSYWEGWSLSLGEAMANGLSCVITDVGSAYEFEIFDNVVVIEPPFGDITQLNYKNMGDFVYGEDAVFENRLAEAMVKVSRTRKSGVSFSISEQIDRGRAYASYVDMFAEVAKKRNVCKTKIR